MWNTQDFVVTECWGGLGEEESVREVSRFSVRGLDGCATPKMRNPKGEADWVARDRSRGEWRR